MKWPFKYVLILLLILFIQCNPENDEDLYYEPLVDDVYQIEIDQNQMINFTIEPNKKVSITGEFEEGIGVKIEFEEDALRSFNPVEASVMPVTKISEFPPDFEFHFGFVFKPEGTQFNNPGRMSIELPAGVDISTLKGVYFQGGIPYDAQPIEIWDVRLTPLIYQEGSGTKQVIIELPHFSGFIAFTGGEFKCGDPVAAEDIKDLKEILACYISGKETLTDKDIGKVNGALRDWMEAGLSWLQKNPEEIDDIWEIEYALTQIVSWKATILFFNDSLDPFDDLVKKIADFFTDILNEKLVTEDGQCNGLADIFDQAISFDMNTPYMVLARNLQSAGMLNEQNVINEFNFCDSIAYKFHTGPFLDTVPAYISIDATSRVIERYIIEFPAEAEPVVSRSRSFNVFATNLLGETIEMIQYEDFVIENFCCINYTLEGTTLTENLTTTTNENGVLVPAYMGGHFSFEIRLTSSNEEIYVIGNRKE